MLVVVVVLGELNTEVITSTKICNKNLAGINIMAKVCDVLNAVLHLVCAVKYTVNSI